MITRFILIGMSMLAMTGCTTTSNWQSIVKPTTFIVAKQVADKKPGNAAKLALVADGLDLVAKGMSLELQYEDFLEITTKAGTDPEFAMLASYLYDIYKEKIQVTQGVANNTIILKNIAQGIRDAIQLVQVQK